MKHVVGGRTVTDVARVSGADREAELARMIGGADISATVLASAREMLAFRAGREQSLAGGSGDTSPQRKQRKRRG
jgi:DNA repair protein RecN (Recombination protein N)